MIRIKPGQPRFTYWPRRYETPSDIFRKGDLGGLWGANHFTDVEGTIPATLGDKIAAIEDPKTQTINWVQANPDYRPTLLDGKLSFVEGRGNIESVETYPAGFYTVVFAGTLGIWIDTMEWEGGKFRVGISSYSGGPAGVLAQLGDLQVEGCILISRELTKSEKEYLINYFGGEVQDFWSPEELFTNGEQGSFWGPLPYYSDAAGTVEAGWGDPVGNIPDASGNGTAWAQVTSTARPILGRVPVGGRRNLLLHTEDFSNSVWTNAFGFAGGPSTRENVSHPDLGTICKVTTQSLTGGVRQRASGLLENSKRYGIRVWIKAGTCSSVRVLLENGSAAFGDGRISTVNLQTGEITGSNAHRSEAVPLYDGWLFTCWWEPKPEGELTANPQISATGQAEEGLTFYLGQPQFQEGEGLFPYQRVGNEYDITEAGVKEIHYLRFDGTDDAVTTTLPAISGGTIVLAGTNGIWIDEIDFAGGEFSVGPDTYTGGPAGLMSILGDLLVGGGFVIDRVLTPEEIAKVKGYYKARGSAGLIELGPELAGEPTYSPYGANTVTGPDEEGFFQVERVDSSAGMVVRPEVETSAGVTCLWDITVIAGPGNSATVRFYDGTNYVSEATTSVSDGIQREVRAVVVRAPGGVAPLSNQNLSSVGYKCRVRLNSVRRLIMPGDTP